MANFLLNILVIFLFISNIQPQSNSSFYIDFDTNSFVRDGKPFQYISGSIHSYRVPNELWQDRLLKMRAAGLNAIQIYLFWNQHEQIPGVYDFQGQNDIFKFVSLAQNIGLVVLFRAGPYGCGEHEYGALPWWLLSNGTKSILPRSNEPNFMFAVRRWYNVLLPKLAPYLYKNGGPIITVQIENEYGSYFSCDSDYKANLRDLFRDKLGEDVVFYTTDGGSVGYLKCGVIPGVYPTVDFGPGSDVKAAFDSQRVYAPKGPLINSEYYTGWLDFWGSPHSTVSTSDIIDGFHTIMSFNASINFYMFHGGTNFGFSNGADPPYQTQPTSYDYDSPITEAGDISMKYLAMRDAISKYLPLPSIPIPANSTKKAYGNVQMNFQATLVDFILEMSTQRIKSSKPMSFEQLGQGYGIVLYMTKLKDPNVYGKILSIPGVRDRAYIQIGYSSVGVLYRNTITSLKINLTNNDDLNLYIIVENMGRLNYGDNLLDSKGILSDVTLDGEILTDWEACLTDNWIPYYQNNISLFNRLEILNKKIKLNLKRSLDYKIPAIYYGSFISEDPSYDTFLKMEKFTKGFALIESGSVLTNLGRYWPNTGPQVTLYTPGVFMPVANNTPSLVYLIELEGSNCKISSNCQVEFIDYPIISSIPN